MMVAEPVLALILAIAGTAVLCSLAIGMGRILGKGPRRGAPAGGMEAGTRRHRGDRPMEPMRGRVAASRGATADALPPHLLGTLMSEVALSFTPAGMLEQASASCLTMLGLTPDQLRHAPDAGADPFATRAMLATLAGLAAGGETTLRVRRGNGDLIWVRARCHAMASPTDGDGGARERIVMLRDITRERLAEAHLSEAVDRLLRLSNQDALTGLANRASFLATAEKMIGGVDRLAVLFIDLHRFRPINDVHGHAVGDAILRETATRLARELVDEPLVARLGADEFAVLMRAPEGDTAIAARARDIIRVIGEPIEIGPMTLDISATIGIAISPRDGAHASVLLRAAGVAMTQARQAGGTCYRFFEQRMTEELATAEELKADLRAAIATGEIVPFFQPLVRLADSAVVGFEVLARWNHPEKGILPPIRFLPLVEEMGLSAAMFAAILSETCATIRDWPESIRVSVNVSPHELQDESLPEDMRAILQRHSVHGARLEIEVTENALIHDSRIARGVIDRLRAMGMTMALDDFGTGFSSLYHLRELPFDKIKIDKSFMRALDTDADSARYVAAIIGLGKALDLEVTAEGIEDHASMVRLRELGCTYGQGYLFGRPVPAAEAAGLLVTRAAPVLAAE